MDFVKNVKERFENEALLDLANVLLASLDELIIANHNMGHIMRDANGVSIYFPTQRSPFKETFEMYEKLDFSKEHPHWVALIKWYYA